MANSISIRNNKSEPFEALPSELDDALNALFGDECDNIIGLSGNSDFPENYAGEDTVIMTPGALSRCGVLDDDDILELTAAISASVNSDEEIQEDDFEKITNLIEKTASVGQPPSEEWPEEGLLDDDDIIELTDRVSASGDGSEGIQEDAFKAIIDIIEKVAPAEHTQVGEDTLTSLPDLTPESFESETEPEPVILLTDILDRRQPRAGKTRMDREDALPPEETDTRPTFTGDAIEAAVERYIRKKYGPAIKEMIARAIEQKVIHEMENLKKSVIEDQAG
jgi:hypothetical protein